MQGVGIVTALRRLATQDARLCLGARTSDMNEPHPTDRVHAGGELARCGGLGTFSGGHSIRRRI